MVIQKEEGRPRLNEPSGEPDTLVGNYLLLIFFR